MKKSITIKKLQLINFRNIENNTYLFNSNRVGIAGKNRIGKTNTILAIHWLLTDKMLDGSSDVMSIKPLHDTTLKVEVKATFDIDGEEISIKKTYEEEWVKTRGTNELVLKGNITEYFINDIPYKVNKALEQMQVLFGLEDIKFMNNTKIDSKINVNSMLINPYYMTQILTEAEEKTLRNFVVNLVGDVFDEDVFKKNPITLGCKNILEKYRSDHTLAMKFLKQQISELNEEIKAVENIVNELQKDKDVAPEELKLALSKIDEINLKIINIKNEKVVDDPRIADLKNEINDLKELLHIKQEKEYSIANENRIQLGSQLRLLEEKKANFEKSLAREKEKELQKEKEVNQLQSEIKLNEYKLSSLNMYINELRNKAKSIKDSEFSMSEDKCPNCGHVLNQEEIEEEKEYFETNKQERFAEVQNEGKKVKLEIENKQKEIESLKQKIFNLTQVLDADETNVDYEAVIKDLEEKITDKRKEISNTYLTFENEEIKNLKFEISQKEQELEDAKNTQLLDNSKDYILNSLKNDLEQYKNVEVKHLMFNETQNRIENNKRKIKSLYNNLNDFETQLLALDLFVKTKLQMIDDNVANVFGDIKIKLIKENIKEGSWQQICKPCIKGKNTLFANGSTSEKITTGLAFIECIKRVLNLSDLPIIFDEGEALDRHSINELKTDSQVITALVNDNYETPTVVNLER